mgnify:FL=1
MKDLTDREFRIKQALEKKGWTIQWRGVPANRWLWASKTKGAKRYISVEMTVEEATLVRGHGSVDWLLGAFGERKEALAENQPDH